MEAVLLPYASQRPCAWPFRAMILASDAIGLLLLAAPLAWYQAGSILMRMFNARHAEGEIITSLAPRVISLPAELMLLTGISGLLLGLFARKRAQVMAQESLVPTIWNVGIALGLVSNLAGVVANGMCLLGA